jgi:Cdc6-like AAA superfamily ATPase
MKTVPFALLMTEMRSLLTFNWLILVLIALAASGLGVLISYFFPGTHDREWKYAWVPKQALLVGTVTAFFVTLGASSRLQDRWWTGLFPVAFVTAVLASYLSSRLPGLRTLLDKQAKTETETSPEIKANQMLFRQSWKSRPRFETGEEGLFVGRAEFVERLDSHFTSDSGGTILISGVRGVGKTALVDRALVSSRQKLQERYWKETARYLSQVRFWHVIDQLVRRKLVQLDGGAASFEPTDYKTLQIRAEEYVSRPATWLRRLDPADRRIRRLHEASRWQLLVLKFSASDISGALPEPGQEIANNPEIDAEKLLRAIIRKLYGTFNPSGPDPEAAVLQWSLRDKAKRQLFFSTLRTAYQKSISKSYKEQITNSLNALIKQSQSSTLEGKLNLEKIGIVLLCVIAVAIAAVYGLKYEWGKWDYLQRLGLPTLIAGYVVLSWSFKKTREKSSDQSNQISFSYEYDYSLHQMREDIESLIHTLIPGRQNSNEPYDPYRCFRHMVIVFDELDKLKQADQQLEGVITHFKNFFTLSDAVFVFLTDHEFYEHLTRATVEARSNRHYPPQHTFFTEKIYLRKPEFARFREAFFKFTDNSWIEQHAYLGPPDPTLLDDLLKRDETSVALIESLPLPSLTPLYVQRGQYKPEQGKAIEEQFKIKGGKKDPLALAQIWASQSARVAGATDLQECRNDFDNVKGWTSSEAVSFLYHRRDDFGDVDQKTIETYFNRLTTSVLSKYEGVDHAQFTLSDLARALCFQTRNHYFDLYNAVYDYVASYDDGAPVVALDQSRYTHEPRLWSRYQQLLEIAFDSARENHPSREYFNALLMESLYRAFDKRRTGQSVSIREILFPPPDELPPPPAEIPPANGNGHENGFRKPVEPFTDRDADKINCAIIRLLRLALAHEAIGGTPDFVASLNNEGLKPPELATFQFSWKDDSHSIIRSVVREQYEQELVRFWETQKVELEAFDLELSALWSALPITGESLRMRTAIGDLRTKAEQVGGGRGTISGPDANGLKANVGTPEDREALWPRIILERIRAEDDADVVEDFSKPRKDVTKEHLVARKVEIEQKTAFKISALIRPRDTDYSIYLVVMSLPVVDVETEMKKLESLLPDKTRLMWYVTGKEAPEFTAGEKIDIYTSSSAAPPPGARHGADLIADYLELVSKERLKQVVDRLERNGYKDAQLAQSAGAEVLGPVNANSSLYEALNQPGPTMATKMLVEQRERFRENGLSALPVLPDNAWSAPGAAKQLALDIVNRGRLSSEFTTIVEKAVLSLSGNVNPTRVTPESWMKTFITSTEDPKAIPSALLTELIWPVMETKLSVLYSANAKLAEAIQGQFVPWLVGNIQALAETKGVELGSMLSSPDWTSDIERQRRALRFSLQPSTQGAATPAHQSAKRKSPATVR